MQDRVPMASSNTSIKAVIVDLAGTVIDYGSCAPAGAFIDLFKKYGLEATLAQARQPMGLHKQDHIRTMLEMPELTQQWEREHGRAWTEEDVASLYHDFIPIQMAALPHYSDMIPGVNELTETLKQQGILIGASTGYNRPMLESVLNLAKAQGWKPDAAVCGSDVSSGRPTPWMIFRLMEMLGVHPPASVVKVGDTLADIKAGINAGAWSVGVVRTGNMIGLSLEDLEALPAEELERRSADAVEAMQAAGAHYVIDSVEELPSVIQDIEVRMGQQAVV